MHISGVDYESIADGVGVRAVVYVSGCSHHCAGCHNPDTHAADFGVEFSPALQDEIIENIKSRPFLRGLTLSGGDPLFESNVAEVLNFIRRVNSAVRRDKFEFDIWLYTGYTWEILQKMREKNGALNELLQSVDVLVDGRFEQNLADKTLAFRGSRNQRLINVPLSSAKNKVILFGVD